MTTKNTPTTATGDIPVTWQLRLLPIMVGLVLTLTLFFFAASLFQLYELNIKISEAPQLQNVDLLEDTASESTLMEKQWRSLVLLESHILQQRYHQANVLLMARIWVRYLGFVTGMMLSLIGAVFILGKLREPTTELTMGSDGEGQKLPHNLKVHLVTQSPGIVLVTLGTVLMLITILVHHPIEVIDKPTYTTVTASVPASGGISSTQTKPAELTPASNTKMEPVGVNNMTSLLRQARERHDEVKKEETSQ